MSRRSGEDFRRRDDGEILRRSGDPIEERFPDRLRLLLIEALKGHRKCDVAAPNEDLFAPMRIEKRFSVEFDGFGDEATIGVVGRRVDGREHPAEEFGQRMRAQSDAGDDAEPAAAAFERPEQVRICAGVGDSDLAVRGHDLRLDEVRAGQSVGLRVAAEAAAQDEAGDADGEAAAALHIAARFRHHLVVDMSPDRARLDRHGRLRLRAALAARADEGVVQRRPRSSAASRSASESAAFDVPW